MSENETKQYIIDMSGTEMDKRFGDGSFFKTVCPACSEDVQVEITELGYAVVGDEYDFNGYCLECDHEWEVGTVRTEVKIIVTENIAT